jgi:nitroreductase
MADLLHTLRTTGAIREFTDAPIPDAALRRILDTARFAPNGGNAQSWHVIAVEDADKRRRLRDLYLDGWHLYLAMRAAGLRPWAPVTDASKEREVVGGALAAGQRPPLGDFAEHLDEVPMLLVVLADLRLLAAVDRDLDRYTFIGGASVYPFVWSLLLAARDEGLGGVITTMPVYKEDEVKALFAIPDTHAVAAVLALGVPKHQFSKLTRKPVDDFATVDAFDGPPLP